jgi:hypothetical protein
MGQKIINSDGETIDNKDNDEVNVGSLSFRALLRGIIPAEELSQLGDRKSGLGSGSAIRKNILDRVISLKKTELFKDRLDKFVKYVYNDDIYIVLKGNYLITWILIPGNSFAECINRIYDQYENDFESIWYRWENNNLRMHWKPIIKYLNIFKLPYEEISFNLSKAVNSEKTIAFKNALADAIEENIAKLI